MPCEIVESAALPAEDEIVKRWGPFASPPEAIARRVGLIRAGKCQPQ
ncbi:MAG: DDE transposase family protein [Geitlerinemataceae cyanobacterium]